MARLFSNNASATLASGISSAAASLALASGTGAKFPSPTGGDYFILTLTQDGIETSWEDVKVTGRAGDTLTISERGYGGSAAAAWAAGSRADIRFTADAAENAANAIRPDSSGNMYANIVPRTGTLSSLLALAGGIGELSCATDADAIVKHNGVAGQAKAFYASGGLILYNNTAVTNDTINSTGFGEVILAATAPTALSFVLPQNPSNGQKIVLRATGALTVTCAVSFYTDAAKSNLFTVATLTAGLSADITFEYVSDMAAWALRSALGPRWNNTLAGDTFPANQTLTSTGLTTNVVQALGSYTLTPGAGLNGSAHNFMLVAVVNFTLGTGAILNNAGVCVSAASGDYISGNVNKPKANIQGPVSNTTDTVEVMVMARLQSIPQTGLTRYINVKANFSGGTVSAAGYVYAFRV